MALSRDAVVQHLQQILGPDRVNTDPEELKRSSVDNFRKLQNIFGIGTITREPTRQRQGVVNVGQHHFRKSLLVVHAASRGHYLSRMNVEVSIG